MFRIPSLASLSDRQLDRLIRRVALILVLGAIAFGAFYTIDRWRPATTPIIDQHLAALEQAVREDPKDVASRGQLADIYVAKKRYEDAIAQYDAILESGSKIELAHMGRGAAYMGLEQYEFAAIDYQAVVDIAKGGEMANVDPMLESAYYNLGVIAMKQGKPADAIVFLESALAIKRSDADALFLVGQAYTQTGETDKAEIVLRAAVAFVPVGWSEPYTALAEAYTKAGRTANAAWAKAMADMAAGRLDLAEPALKALVDGDAAIDASLGLGLLYETRGDTANAATWYTRVLNVDPSNDVARLGMGRVGPVPTALPPLPSPGGGQP